MPCQPRKARLLLKAGEAKVVRRVPFTIQLLFGSSGYKQEVALGIDAGTQHIGVSATTDRPVLFEAEVAPNPTFSDYLQHAGSCAVPEETEKRGIARSDFSEEKTPRLASPVGSAQGRRPYQNDQVGAQDFASLPHDD